MQIRRVTMLLFGVSFLVCGGLSAQNVTEFPLASDACCPQHITAGADGGLWFTEFSRSGGVSRIGRITTAGSVVDFPIEEGFVADANDIAPGPDGNIWFTQSDIEGGRSTINRMTPAGVLTRFPTAPVFPGPFPSFTGPFGITAGPDGNLWVTLNEANSIARVTTAGEFRFFSIPTPGSRPAGIAAGPDGNLWFTEWLGNKIGRITPAGVITEFSSPTPDSAPAGITAGPDGNIWFTERRAARIGRLTLAHAPAIDSRILPVVGSAPGVGGSFFRTSVQLHNPTSSAMSGRIVFHSSGISGNASDPSLYYSLAPGQTQSISDLLPAMGRSGLGSADIEATSGSAPSVTARVFNDAGAAGTTGFTEELMRPDEALQPGQSGVLLLPADVTRFRFNLGVRTLEGGVAATLTVRDAAGAVVAAVSRAFSATYHEQQSAAFLELATLPPGGSITIAVSSGAAIFYGATVDNTTGDPSLQVARSTP